MKKTPQIHEMLNSCLQILESSNEESLESVLQRFPEYAEQLKPMLETAIWLREHRSEFNPRPGYIHASRQRVMARIERNAEPSRNKVPGFNFFQLHRVLVTLLVLVLLVFGSYGVAQASQPALPGDVLYPVKISLEEAQLALSPVEAKAELSVQFVERRYDELQALVMAGRQEDIPFAVARIKQQIDDALARIDRLALQNRLEGGNIASALNQVLLEQSTAMVSLLNIVPLEAQSQLEEVVELSRRGMESVRQQFPVAVPPPPNGSNGSETEVSTETQEASSPEPQSTPAPLSAGTLPVNQPSAPVVDPITSPVSNEPALGTPEPKPTDSASSIPVKTKPPKPAKPAKPVKPEHPEHPDHPEKPDKPGKNR